MQSSSKNNLSIFRGWLLYIEIKAKVAVFSYFSCICVWFPALTNTFNFFERNIISVVKLPGGDVQLILSHFATNLSSDIIGVEYLTSMGDCCYFASKIEKVLIPSF